MSANNSFGDQNNSDQKSIQKLCSDSETAIHTNIALYLIQLIPMGISLLGTLALLIIYCRNRVAVHGNLLILFSAIIAFSFLNNLGFFCINSTYIVFFVSYKNDCDLLIPLWLIALYLGPCYAYFIAYPLLHFCIVVERIRATVMARKYEREGQRLGRWMVAIITFFSIGFAIFVVCSAFADPAMTSHSLPFFYLSSKYNNSTIYYANIFTLLLTILTAFCSYRITQINRRIRRQSNKFEKYNLSKNYQLNENALAMRLIMPLDVLYALLYSIYTALTIFIRANQSTWKLHNYIFYFILANTLLHFYSAFTLIVYIRFVKFVSRFQHRPVEVETKSQVEHSKIYFRQLEAQWR